MHTTTANTWTELQFSHQSDTVTSPHYRTNHKIGSNQRIQTKQGIRFLNQKISLMKKYLFHLSYNFKEPVAKEPVH